MTKVMPSNDALRELAHVAARAFCTEFNFTAAQLQALDGKPLLENIPLERHGRQVLAFRWLGGGRGEAYVQPEVSPDGTHVIVYGGFSHREFGPWPYQPTEA